MKSCHHSHWLGLYKRDNEITFAQSDRAETLLHSLPYLESQKPTLLVLVGNRSKERALKELALPRTTKNSQSSRGYGEIHLHLDPSTTFSDRPILIADGDIPLQPKAHKVVPLDQCHEITNRSLIGFGDVQAAADSLYFRLLSPFTDVFCFFASDLGGLQPIARVIAAWMNAGQPSTLPATARSQIIIVTEPSATEGQESRILDRFLLLLAQETRTDPLTFFGSIRVLSLLPDGDLSPSARHRKLKEVLMDAVDHVRLARIESRTLFSAQHLAAFLSQAYSHFAASCKEPFNFIQASRIDNPPAADLKEHLTRFLLKMKSLGELKSFAIPLIASSLLLDSYPPDMHCK